MPQQSLEQLNRVLRGSASLAIIGIGNEMRGDDGVGVEIVKKLKVESKKDNVHIYVGGTTPENLTGTLKKVKPTNVLLIDAAKSGKEPGTISVIDPDNIEGISFSTHTIPLNVLAKYIRDEIGAEVMIIGIEPKVLDLKEGLSAEIKTAADGIVESLKDPV